MNLFSCRGCGHASTMHKRRKAGKLGEWFRVCVYEYNEKEVCGCNVATPPEYPGVHCTVCGRLFPSGEEANAHCRPEGWREMKV